MADWAYWLYIVVFVALIALVIRSIVRRLKMLNARIAELDAENKSALPEDPYAFLAERLNDEVRRGERKR